MKGMKIFALLILLLGVMNSGAMNEEESKDLIDLEFELWFAIFSIELSAISLYYSADNCRKRIEQLLKKEVNPNSRNPFNSSFGTIPLIYAISLLDVDLVKLFLSYKVDIDLVDPVNGDTAIHKILDYLEPNLPATQNADVLKGSKIFDLLVASGADLNITNQSGQTATQRMLLLF
jgi:ankyrin repeat protein